MFLLICHPKGKRCRFIVCFYRHAQPALQINPLVIGPDLSCTVLDSLGSIQPSCLLALGTSILTLQSLPSQVPILLLGTKCVSRTAIFELASRRWGSNLGRPITGSNCTFTLTTQPRRTQTYPIARS